MSDDLQPVRETISRTRHCQPARRGTTAHELALAGTFVAAVLATARPAGAQVTEPNGVVVPVVASTQETTLQSYFDAEMETIDAVRDASVNPGVFLPLCDFQATLVLSQSGAEGGIAWYNVPASPTDAPAAVNTILAPTTTTGQLISSSDVRNDPNYAGGLIGFVLQKPG